MTDTAATSNVLKVSNLAAHQLATVLAQFGLQLQISAATDTAIPGSYWGDSEAGLIDQVVHARSDTPVHSVLHESCHFICMPPKRRMDLHTDAGGDYDEENAVCYLQILLADQVRGMGRERMLADMDAWGYSFRLGSARAWFEQDADDARAQLLQWGLIDGADQVLGRVRGQEMPASRANSSPRC